MVVCDGNDAPMLAADTGVNVTLSCSWCRDEDSRDERGDFNSSLPPWNSAFMSFDFDEVGVSEMAADDDDDELS